MKQVNQLELTYSFSRHVAIKVPVRVPVQSKVALCVTFPLGDMTSMSAGEGSVTPTKQKKQRAKHTPDPNAPKTWHPCTFCDKVFQRRDKLTRHILTHTQEKPHVCPDCGKGFGR